MATAADSTIRSLEKVDDLLRFESFSDGIFERFSDIVAELIPFDRMSILFYVAERRQAEIAYTTGESLPPFEKGFRHSVQDEVAEIWLGNSRAFVPGDSTLRDRQVVDRLNFSARSDAFKSWAVAPIIWKGERIGDLHFRAFDEGVYGRRELDLSNLLTDKIAGVVSNARAITEARNELSLRESLTTLSELVSSTSSLQDIREPFGEHATRLVGADRLSVTVWDDSARKATNLLVYGPQIKEFEIGAHGPTRNPREFRWLTETAPYIIDKSNFMDSVASQWSYEIALKSGMHSALVAPVLWQGNQIAALTFRSKTENRFGQYESELAAAIAGQIAGAVASKFALDEQERWADERESLAKIGQIVTSSNSLDDVFSRFAEVVNELVPTDRLGLTVLEEGGDKPIRWFNFGRGLAELKPGELPLSRGQISAILRQHRAPMVVDDSTPGAKDDILVANRLAKEVGLKSWMAAPMFWQDQLIGNLHFRSDKEDAYGADELRLAGEIAQQIAGAVANSISLEKLERETNI
ncbi:GAF domain-containing protein [Candidatus Lucifugimonas marina]|uniref:GAF domain-containing protein n=1 Tax=Candidatus Lucifugimonas marina TaxID=3038979 RepID=A0AAJ5ZD08_9CHLR|nr:GAF domain-containing protein [SAR202 cluster bacterium JH702]MDG0870701.1 GAF domain-containing protein [SAR202 cluster bacterium JH639]WFG34785.1 GAF domain-containing protein [SAR202 cluster bacterium JH545]WFG38725.1 GAF domain-containing protein [SAR202 cluster bacterium JH1073]